MNLDTCTPGQRSIITTLDEPLMVSAGAGSGKTFTLTQRIAYALECAQAKEETDGAGRAAHEGIDAVLAITFTKKAAAELKSRIKHRLLEMGMVDDALKVDDAWISTIHGMCSRILREHALELGIDPSFTVVSETESRRMRDEAFEVVVRRIKESEDQGALGAYVDRVGVHAMQGNGPSIESYVRTITDRSLALPGGFESLVLPEVQGDPRKLLREMIVLGEEFLSVGATLKKPGKTDAKYLQEAEKALSCALDLLGSSLPDSFDDPRFDAQEFAEAFFAFPKTSGRYRVKESDPTFYADYRQAYLELALQVEAALSAQEQHCIAKIACGVYAEYQCIKTSSALDNTDLLRMTYDALVDRPRLAQGYRDMFSLIMIDEFQDTDELQIALLRALAKDDLSNVCTVGDAQQSIYRFRGADVAVFYEYRKMLEELSSRAKFVDLPDNFRSHADVLSFVDRVFSQRDVFGDRFLSLAPKGPVNAHPDPLFDERPRISMALFECHQGGPGTQGGRVMCAQRIAAHFAELREAGASPSEMTILLGSMSNVDVYAQALRDEGFECLVSGGSVFSESPEVKLCASVLAAVVNRFDDQALFEVLTSPLFSISDDALVFLATTYDPQGHMRRRGLSAGFTAWEKERGLSGLPVAEKDNLDFAYGCFQMLYRASEQGGLTCGLETLLRASGWLIRLEGQGAEGQAIVGNIHKALRMLEDIEALGLGWARSLERFRDDCATLKLTPGALATTSSDFVKIMTVHASKGLEFPHVAISELRLTQRSDAIVAENIAGNTYCTVKPSSLKRVDKVLSALHGYQDPFEGMAHEVLEAPSQGRREQALKAFVSQQELSEARRLLYVALTRASKSLFLGLTYRGTKDFSYAGKGILGDLYSALSWEPSAEAPVQYCDYGGSAPLRLELHVLTEPLPECSEMRSEQTSFLIPSCPLRPFPYAQTYHLDHDEVFSYSSLPGYALNVDMQAGHAREEEVFEVREQSMFPEGDHLSGDEDATALGQAFHRLAQGAIDMSAEGLERPSHGRVEICRKRYGLTDEQAVRLDRALDRWFESTLIQRLSDHAVLKAEVPFMVALDSSDGPVFMEGEIDALAYDTLEGGAYLVDYKTGGTAYESSESIHNKHLLQAQCYALALLMRGFASVEAVFVRVEWEDPCAPSEPQTQRYYFTQDDRAALERTILSVYGRRS